MADVELQKRKFQRELEEAEETDPLSAWSSHLGWFEERKMTSHPGYREALQQCIEYFSSVPHFNSDIRLATIYVKSASVSKDAITVYKHMLSENIGTQHALVYVNMATALCEQGKRQEAVKILETGIKKKAHPVRVLQRKFDSLQGQENQVKSSRASTSNAGLDERSERNQAFYSQPGQRVCYPKALVYPPDGGEQSLEHIRGQLPQYQPMFPDVSEGEGECDMEMTMAFTAHITECVRLVPDLSKKGKAVLPKKISSNAASLYSGAPDKGYGVVQSSAPLNPVRDESEELDELEEFCAKKEPSFVMKPPAPQEKDGNYTEQDFEQQLEQLVMEKEQLKQSQPRPNLSYGRDKENQPQPNLSYVRDKENQPQSNLSYVKDKENQPQSSAMKAAGFDFTPNTIDGGLHWPGRMNNSSSGFPNTKLNFSDISLSNHSQLSMVGGEEGNTSRHHHSINRSASSAHKLGMFNTALDIEKRAKLTDEQLKFEKEFATTEVEVMEPSMNSMQSFEVYHDSWVGNTSRSVHQQKSFSTSVMSKHNDTSMQSFEVFHDSWMNQPGNTSRSIHQQKPPSAAVSAKLTDRKQSSTHQIGVKNTLNPPAVVERRPLQVLPHNDPPPSSLSQSQSDDDSFSVYEDEPQEQSSFVPFHDSWANNVSKSGISAVERANVHDGVFKAPLGVPIKAATTTTDEDHQKSFNYTMDEKFTQFDIPHPQAFAPISTPMHIAPRMNATLDISAIPGDDVRVKPMHRQPPTTSDLQIHEEPDSEVQPVSHISQKMGVMNLSTIPEESGSYKSTSSSRLATSSSSSSSVSHDTSLEKINPFECHIINRMLNSLGVPVGKIEKVSGTFPKFIKGHDITLGNELYTDVSQIAEGGFAKVYLTKQQGVHKILKVEKPPCEWEVAALEEIHSRLRSSGLQYLCSYIIQYERALRYEDTSVLVLPYYPHGTILDLVNTNKTLRSPFPESMLLYYTTEVCNAVDALHQMGIIHADIKPDNFMLRDIRSFDSFQSAKGKGVCLIDFGRAIDTKLFPEDQLFVGSSNTEGFQCGAMLEGEPWKWQVDYYGLAGTIFSLMHGGYMETKKNAADGRYRPTVKVKRRYDVGLWSKVFEFLLNVPCCSLSQLVQPLEEQLYSGMNHDFKVEVATSIENIITFLKNK